MQRFDVLVRNEPYQRYLLLKQQRQNDSEDKRRRANITTSSYLRISMKTNQVFKIFHLNWNAIEGSLSHRSSRGDLSKYFPPIYPN